MGRIVSVTLKVGALRQVVPEIMHFVFDTAIKGSFLDGAKLVIDQVPIQYKCDRCGTEWGAENLGFYCPKCGSSETKMTHGTELEIDSMEVEQNDDEKD